MFLCIRWKEDKKKTIYAGRGIPQTAKMRPLLDNILSLWSSLPLRTDIVAFLWVAWTSCISNDHIVDDGLHIAEQLIISFVTLYWFFSKIKSNCTSFKILLVYIKHLSESLLRYKLYYIHFIVVGKIELA